MKINAKKILFLGANQRASYVVKRAQELGYYVVVADPYPDSPAKEFADESVQIDAADVKALAEYSRGANISGVMTGYVDALLHPCMELADELGLPCYLTEEMIRMSTDKNYFKEMCSKYDVPVPKTYSVADAKFPAFIKPSDNSGSRGASACNSAEEFDSLYNTALEFSKNKKVVIEELLTGTEFILDYLLIDGKAYLLSMADRYITPGRSLAINSPNLMRLPSRHLDFYIQEIDSKVRNMLRSMGFKNGIIFLQGYASENRIAFYEMGCRLGGTWPYIDQFFSGKNPLDNLINFSVSGSMGSYTANLVPARFSGKAAIIYFLANTAKGKIARIAGINAVEKMPQTVAVMQHYKEGSEFDKKKQSDVRFLAIHLASENEDDLASALEKTYSLVDVRDEQDKSLCSPHYDEKIWAVIGAGNGGQAFAGHLALMGKRVRLHTGTQEKASAINALGGIELHGDLDGLGKIELVTTQMEHAVRGAKYIIIVLPSLYHEDIAWQMIPFLEDGQTVLLLPEASCGALAFRNQMKKQNCNKNIILGAAATLPYTCRCMRHGCVNVICVKKEVKIAALPASDNEKFLNLFKNLFPSFQLCSSVLETSTDNINAFVHPAPVLLNTSRIEAVPAQTYEYYRDGITPGIAAVLEKMDEERIALADAFGYKQRTLRQEFREMYECGDDSMSLYELIHCNPGYAGIMNVKSMRERYTMEDIPFSLVPLSSLGKIAGVKTPVIDSLIALGTAMLGKDLKEGRTLSAMGLAGMSRDEFLKMIFG